MDDEKRLQIDAFRAFRIAYECITDELIVLHGAEFDRRQLTWNVDNRKTCAVPESLDLCYRGEPVMAFLKVPSRPFQAQWYRMATVH